MLIFKTSIKLQPIGSVKRNEEEIFIHINNKFIPAIKELENFSHMQVLWWADIHDNRKSKNTMQITPAIGKDAPVTGVFALRTDFRPNPICLTVARIKEIDNKKGIIQLQNLDAFDGSYVIDLKPYIPAYDRVKDVEVPDWLKNLPEWVPEEGIGLEFLIE